MIVPAGRAAALAGALAADRLLGEPRGGWHPVALFGRAMTRLEERLWADRRAAGVLYTAVGVAAPAGLGVALSAGRPWRRRLILVASTYTAVAGRALAEAAMDVHRALEDGDLGLARTRLRSLVGRDTRGLDEAEIVRAVVESVAENTVDAVTAPLLWALVAGAPGVLGYRAVNTLDAMVGHRSPRYARFGWASARADDLVNWVPARLTAALVAAARPARAAAIGRAVHRQAPAHPSPNAGVVEAAFAAALGVRLGGVNDYGGRMECRPTLGWGRPAARSDIAEACRLSRTVAVALVAAAGLAPKAWPWR